MSDSDRKDELDKLKAAIQDRMNHAEYALELLADGTHRHLQNFLNGFTTNFRVMEDPSILEEAHSQTKNAIELLQKHSKAAGTIRPTFVNGELHFTVYSVDLNQAELLSRSQSDLACVLFQAIGLTEPTNPLLAMPNDFTWKPKEKR